MQQYKMMVDEEAIYASSEPKNVTESGVYKVTIKKVKIVPSQLNQAWGIRLSATTEQGLNLEAGLQVANKDGGFNYERDGVIKPLIGYSLFNAIFAMCGIKMIKPTEIITDEDESEIVYKDLQGKEICLGIQKEFYYNNKNEEKYKMTIVRVFDPDTNQSASEKKNNKEAKEFLEIIKDKPTKERK